MKKHLVFLLTFALVAGVAFIAYAGHDQMVIPYEAQALGYKTTMPIPTGRDLRNHIIGHMPYKQWNKWPGTGEMYEGTEPHGSYITVYVNDIAHKSIKKLKGMDNNSIILKENYTPKKKLAAVTIMYKVKGYNPDKGDWFWVKYDPNFKVIKEGKVPGCLGCHAGAIDNDYVYVGKVIDQRSDGSSAPGYGKPDKKGAATGYGTPGYGAPGKK